MSLFSQRKGLKPGKKALQIGSLDNETIIAIWNILTIVYFNVMRHQYYSLSSDSQMATFIQRLWMNYFKMPIDSIDDRGMSTYREIKDYLFSCEWNEVLDFIEFAAKNFPNASKNQDFVKGIDRIFKTEVVGYRFIGEEIVGITSEEEITEIEEALDIPLNPVAIHLRKALELLSDRKSPDYPNSIKESISAVEAICQQITGKKGATLGQALKEIKKKVELHPALESAFSKLYGYTSSADGIRHALLEESNLDFEDAKFMLVSCSAFINYLTVKSSKAEIKLK